MFVRLIDKMDVEESGFFFFTLSKTVTLTEQLKF